MEEMEIIDTELCKSCIHTKDAAAHTKSVCEVCYQIDNIDNGENYHFRGKEPKPDNCGQCVHCMHPEDNTYYCDASGAFNTNDRYIQMEPIRKNYLSKGTPKWCPMSK